MTLAADLVSLAEALEDDRGELVTYKRKLRTITGLLVIRDRSTPQALAIADGRADLTAHPQDWLVRPARIDFGDGPVDPADGDRITTAAGEVYEVKPRDGEPGWRKSDPFGVLLRLRTTREG